MPKLIIKNINQGLLTANFFLDKKLVKISSEKNVTAIEKNVENSLLRTVFNENPSSGFSQFLKRGITMGVFLAHSIN